MKSIYLFGRLGKQFGFKHELNVNSVEEMIRAMSANYPKFKTELKNGKYNIKNAGEFMTSDEMKMSKSGDYYIIPAIEGSFWTAILIAVGSMVASVGISLLLAPTPVEIKEEDSSDLFGNDLNNIKEGVSIPLVYGETFIGSTVVSTQVFIEDISD